MMNKTDQGQTDLLQRLQALLYEYHELGCFREARPHILWLMEIAEERVQGVEHRSAA
jgi:hypothetical protein